MASTDDIKGVAREKIAQKLGRFIVDYRREKALTPVEFARGYVNQILSSFNDYLDLLEKLSDLRLRGKDVFIGLMERDAELPRR